MNSADRYSISFPTKPTAVFRDANKVTFIDETGTVSSICLVLDDIGANVAAVDYVRLGMDPVRMVSGPASEIVRAFNEFAEPKQQQPGNIDWVRIASVGVAALSVLFVGFFLMRQPDNAEKPSAARVDALEKLSRQIATMTGDPNRPAAEVLGAPSSGVKTTDAALAPVAAPMQYKSVTVKPAPEAPRPAVSTPVAAAIAVPTHLPALPTASDVETTRLAPASTGSRTTVDIASITDAEPASDNPAATATKGAATASVTVTDDKPVPLEKASPGKPEATPEKTAKPGVDRIDPKIDPKADKVEADKVGADKPSADSEQGIAVKGNSTPMSPAQAQELLKTLEQIKSQAENGGELTPELLKQLPMDVARRLVGTGIATVSPKERAERAERMARIVRLPASIINAHRGRDGIASIPEQDSWVANGGRITIPLPGGGDVLEPGILKEFGLEP